VRILVIDDNPEDRFLATREPSPRGGHGTRLIPSPSRQAGADGGTGSGPGRGTRLAISFPKA
jgi:hypothetical protein